MNNYVYLKEKEMFRPTEFTTFNIQSIDLMQEDHQKSFK